MGKAKAAVPVPASYDAANDLLLEHARVTRDLEKLDARLSLKVAKLTALIEKSATPLKDRLKAIEAQVKAYADANRKTLTEDEKVKHHDMPAGRIGWRTNPPSVKWDKGVKAEDVLANIKAVMKRLLKRADPEDHKRAVVVETFIRTVEEPNKEAMLAAPSLAMLVAGVRIGSSGEKFYLEPKAAKLSGGEP